MNDVTTVVAGITPAQGTRRVVAALDHSDADQWAVLAGLRFLLAFVVLCGHCTSYSGDTTSWCDFGLRLNQGSAVFGFLVVSGFSIASSLERRPNTARFIERRVNRIYPVYLASIVLALIAMHLNTRGLVVFPGGIPIRSDSFFGLVAQILMLQGIAHIAMSADGQAWSLAVEWWMYMIAPVLSKLKAIAMTAIPVLIICSFGLYVGASRVDFQPSVAMYGESIAALAWLWLTGFVYYHHRSNRWAIALLVFPTICAIYEGCFVGVPLVFTLLVILVCDLIPVKPRFARVLYWLGDLSYPVYMISLPVIFGCFFLGSVNPTVWVVASLAMSIAVLYLVDYPTRGKLRLIPAAKATGSQPEQAARV